MLSYKRKAFSYEKEIRIILVPKNENFSFDKEGCLKIGKIDYSVIVKRIWLEPVPTPPGWLTEDSAKRKLGKLGEITHQSVLYERGSVCKKIDLRTLK